MIADLLYRYPDAVLILTGVAFFVLAHVLRRWGLNSVQEQST